MLVIYALIQLIFLYVFADRHVKSYKYYCLEVVKPSILTCFLKSKERFSMIQEWLWCWIRVLHVWHYYVLMISIKFNLSGYFSMKRCLIYSTLFSINWDEHFFPIYSVNVCAIQIHFNRLKHSCIPKRNPTCSWCRILIICCCCSKVMSESVRPHRWQPTRLCHPWDSPGKNTGVDCHR